MDQQTNSEKLIGESLAIKNVLNQIKIIAPTNVTVILQGESGTGKELLAHLIHQDSPRKDGPFVAIDCGTIPETLGESELFGYEKGAFTGASFSKEGKFEQANGGTLFLDEINNLPFTLQMKFLRVLQEKKIQRVGGKKEIGIDVRIIVATNINLLEAVQKEKKFRNDLFYRLNEFNINLPSLKERGEDVVLLAKYFLAQANIEFNKKIKGFSAEIIDFFLNYSWPGNIRELKNVVRKAVLLTESDYVTIANLKRPEEKNIYLQNEIDFMRNLETGVSFDEISTNVEKYLIKNALRQSGNNKIKAAELLRINPKTFYRKMKNLEL